MGTRSATTRAEAVAQLIAAGVTRGSDAADDGNEAVATTAAVEPEGDTLWNKKTFHTLKIKTADGAKALFGGFHACTPLPVQLAGFDKKFYRVELPIIDSNTPSKASGIVSPFSLHFNVARHTTLSRD